MQKIVELKIEETKAVVGGIKVSVPVSGTVSAQPPVAKEPSPFLPISF
jgi:hypothetical protein